MGLPNVPNAVPLTDTIAVTAVKTVLDLSAKEYCAFLLDNQGDETINITLLPQQKTLKLSGGMYIFFEQDNTSSIEIATETGKTSTLMYFIQGNA